VEGHPEPLVRVEGFSCWYADAERSVLDKLDLALPAGQLALLVGASGSGKTSLALCLNGIIPHVLNTRTEGRIVVDGLDVARHSVAQMATRVGIIFQDPDSQFVSLYVRDEIAFGPENLLLPREDILARMERAADFVGLSDWAHRFVYELSGGQKQRVNVAAMLTMEPRLLVLDEPTANLDPRSAAEVWDLIARLREQGLTVLVIENRLDDLDTRVDRLLVLDRGRLCFDGPPREVLADHGETIMEDLGLWVPQYSELELQLRRKRARVFPSLPVTLDEALAAYSTYEFHSLRAGNGQTKRNGAHAERPTEPVIRVRSASYIYPSGAAALRDVSLDIRPGELMAIVGPNGSGKTTLVKHFVGLLKPTAGQVEVFGRDTRQVPVRELASKVGFVFQFPEHQFVKDSVEDELRFSLRVAGTPADQIEDRVREVLELLDLEGLERRHPFSLSGGQKRRLSVAAVVVTRPSVLILDEPTYAQDRHNTIQMMHSIVELLGHGEREAGALSILLVTHDMRLVADYAHRAVVMRQGSVAFDGPVEAMFEDRALLDSANLEPAPILELIHSLRQRGRVDASVISLDGLVRALV
jgi:energy-coupling factor transport system ATP-binding protein